VTTHLSSSDLQTPALQDLRLTYAITVFLGLLHSETQHHRMGMVGSGGLPDPAVWPTRPGISCLRNLVSLCKLLPNQFYTSDIHVVCHNLQINSSPRYFEWLKLQIISSDDISQSADSDCPMHQVAQNHIINTNHPHSYQRTWV
jgi:hypothetical protein